MVDLKSRGYRKFKTDDIIRLRHSYFYDKMRFDDVWLTFKTGRENVVTIASSGEHCTNANTKAPWLSQTRERGT